MVFVAVYVVGVALYVIPPAGGAMQVLMPHTDGTARGIALATHKTTLSLNGVAPTSNFTGTKVRVEGAKGEFDAGDLMSHVADMASLRPGAEAKPAAAHLVLDLPGAWRARSFVDCGKPFAASTDFSLEHNFILANQAYRVKLKGTAASPLATLGNGVLFTTIVPEKDLESMFAVDGGEVKLTAANPNDCAAVLGFAESGATSCATIKLVHGAAPGTEPPPGSPDVHFLSLYQLLREPGQPSDWWMPILARGESPCAEVVGNGGHGTCTGAAVKAK